MAKGKFVFGIVVVLFARQALGETLERVVDDFVIDWTRMELRFSGEINVGVQDTFVEAEALARREAVRKLKTSWPSVRSHLIAQGQGVNLLDSVDSQRARSFETIYSTDGLVLVSMRLPLAAALKPAGRASVDTANEPRESFVVEIQGKFQPTLEFTLIDESGRLLFASSQINAAAIAQDRVGSWLDRAKREGAKPYLAVSNPVQISATMPSTGVLQVSSVAWEQVAAAAIPRLRSGRIVFVEK